MKRLILIPCCARKRPGGKDVEGRRIEGDIGSDYKEKLLGMRSTVAGSFNIDLDSGEELLPAFVRYNGHLYSKVPNKAWENLNSMDDTEVVIISALYGLIYWDQPIINYDIEMDESIFPGRWLNTWWKNNSLSNILSDYIKENKFEKVDSLLSNNYQRAISRAERKAGIKWETYDYTGLGSGSNYHRGKDLKKLLLLY